MSHNSIRPGRALRVALALGVSVGLVTGCGVISFGEGAGRRGEPEPLKTPSSEAEHRERAKASLALLHLSLPEDSSRVQWAPAPKMGAKDSNVKDAAVVSFRAPMTGALLRRFCPHRFGGIVADKDIFELLFADEDIVKMDGNTPGIPGLRPAEVESLDAVSAAKGTGICKYNAIDEAGEGRIWHVLVAPGNPAEFKILLYRYTRQ